MSRDTSLLRGRNAAARGMVDTCKIEHPTGATTHPVTGTVARTYTTVYTGACRVRQAAATWAGPADVAEAALRLLSTELQLPVKGSEGLQIDDRVTVLTCRYDTGLVGRVYTITGENRKSHATTRKLPLLEVLS